MSTNGSMTRSSRDTKKLLSIQSHVVHGYVGNRAATFPLQVRGWDVDALNTVQFSNHPAYGKFKGQKCPPETLREIYEGLIDIKVQYDAVLTGYIPGDDGLEIVSQICTSLCQRGIKWILDPVLGDNGRIYVSEGNIKIYKNILMSGDVHTVTPNQLELEVLSGVKVDSLESLKTAITAFNHQYPVKNTIVTSVELADDTNSLYSAGSLYTVDGILRSFYFKVPRIRAGFSGSGDLFSAILTSAIMKYDDRQDSEITETTALEDISLVHALNEALSVVEKVLLLTFDYEVRAYKEKGVPLPVDVKINDLKLIQGRRYYEIDMGHFEPNAL